MRWVVPLVVACVACTPKRVPKKPVDEPKLDIVAPWLDPADWWPKGEPEKRRPLSDALADPGTPPIVIRGATIMTATGHRYDSGTIVVERGVPSPFDDGSRKRRAGSNGLRCPVGQSFPAPYRGRCR